MAFLTSLLHNKAHLYSVPEQETSHAFGMRLYWRGVG